MTAETKHSSEDKFWFGHFTATCLNVTKEYDRPYTRSRKIGAAVATPFLYVLSIVAQILGLALLLVYALVEFCARCLEIASESVLEFSLKRQGILTPSKAWAWAWGRMTNAKFALCSRERRFRYYYKAWQDQYPEFTADELPERLRDEFVNYGLLPKPADTEV